MQTIFRYLRVRFFDEFADVGTHLAAPVAELCDLSVMSSEGDLIFCRHQSVRATTCSRTAKNRGHAALAPWYACC